MPKYGNSAPGSQKWNFSKRNHFFEKVSRFRFQQALNYPQTLSLTLSQVMQEKRDFGSLIPNMEIRPQAPKNGIFQKISLF